MEAAERRLRHCGVRGHRGGHTLTRPASEIPVGDLIRAIDGPLAPVRCASLSAYEPCADCIDPERCSLRALMRETRSALAGVLDGCSLQALSERGQHEFPAHARSAVLADGEHMHVSPQPRPAPPPATTRKPPSTARHSRSERLFPGSRAPS